MLPRTRSAPYINLPLIVWVYGMCMPFCGTTGATPQFLIPPTNGCGYLSRWLGVVKVGPRPSIQPFGPLAVCKVGGPRMSRHSREGKH